MDISSLCRLPLLGLAALIILSGCTKDQRVGSPDFEYAGDISGGVDTSTLVRLTEEEREAFANVSQLDKDLDPAMTTQVRGHFVKYAREKRPAMEMFLRNSMPYLNYTKSVFRQRGMPEDLAYLAYLESGYSPVAVSRSKATGMWQFIASTGKVYGLRQDWWMDQRMDPYRSTEAAADYLARLYEIFHDWHLAIASYNGGEGAVGRAKKAAGADGLQELIDKNGRLGQSLQLREETRLYVPRFLAIAKVMRNADKLGLKPAAPDEDHPVLLPVVALKAKPGTDLVELSRRLGMTWKEFLAYNPHFLRSISPMDRSSSVYLPRSKESQARRLLAGSVSGSGWTSYTVVSGDSFSRISRKTGVPASVIKQINPGKLKKGKRLRLPSRAGSVPPVKPYDPSREVAAAPASPVMGDHVTAALAELEQVRTMPATHTVASGDTLSGIALKYGTTVRELQKANGGADRLKTLRVGQVLDLPGAKAAPTEHKVASGDTLSGIALQYGTTVRDLQKANGGADRLKTLRVGQIIRLPGAPAPAKAEPAKAVAVRRAVPTEHEVAKGDTLTGIALKYGTTVRDLQEANGGADRLKTLRVGQTIVLPGASPASAKAAPVPAVAKPAPAKAVPARKAMPTEHEVASGDTLSGIARKYGTTVRDLQEANGGADRLKTLRIGQIIRLPGAPAPAKAEPAKAEAAPAKAVAAPAVAKPAPAKAVPASPAPKRLPSRHTVAKGDTLSSIARKYGTSVAEVQAANGGAAKVATLRIGQELKLPEKMGEHKVQGGESVWSVARKYGMTPAELLRVNGLKKDASLRVGDTVTVILNK